MTISIYPGSFDPITFGHLDVIKRGATLFDTLVVAVANNISKKCLFSINERMEMIKKAVKNIKNVEVKKFDGLVIDYVKKLNSNIILRGIRTVSDFEYEFQMALTNRVLSGQIETLFVMTSEKYSFMSSHLVKEAAFLGADISAFVPECVQKKLKEKYKNK